MNMRNTLFFLFLLVCYQLLSAGETIRVLSIYGDITPTTAEYVRDGIIAAENNHEHAVIVELDTPGGLLESTRDIVSFFLTSKVPVIVYVNPQGGRAASAGTFITMAADVAVMAPGTNIGAAHPVDIEGPMDSIMSGKVTNDAAAFIRSISEKRHRNIEWAERAVRHSVSITENEAVKLNVIDFIAPSFDAMLDSLDGVSIDRNGKSFTFHTADAAIIDQPMSWRHELLDFLSDPTIAYIFLLIGIYGLIFELSNPGAVLPGVAGAIALVLALYSMQTLPVNYAGLALLAVGIVMFLLEIKVTSYGLLTLGGIAALFFGSVMLYQDDDPFQVIRVSMSVIIPVVLLSAAFFVFVVGAGLRAQKRKVTTGEQAMVGMTGVVVTTLNPSGQVKVQGEVWNAECPDGTLKKGEKIVVTAVLGLTLIVKSVQ